MVKHLIVNLLAIFLPVLVLWLICFVWLSSASLRSRTFHNTHTKYCRNVFQRSCFHLISRIENELTSCTASKIVKPFGPLLNPLKQTSTAPHCLQYKNLIGNWPTLLRRKDIYLLLCLLCETCAVAGPTLMSDIRIRQTEDRNTLRNLDVT